MSLFLLTAAGMFGRAEYLLYHSQDAVRASRMWPLTGFTFFLGGVASFAVSVRTKELGIRMAPGATKRDGEVRSGAAAS